MFPVVDLAGRRLVPARVVADVEGRDLVPRRLDVRHEVPSVTCWWYMSFTILHDGLFTALQIA